MAAHTRETAQEPENTSAKKDAKTGVGCTAEKRSTPILCCEVVLPSLSLVDESVGWA
jgi:hypothetical protein